MQLNGDGFCVFSLNLTDFSGFDGNAFWVFSLGLFVLYFFLSFYSGMGNGCFCIFLRFVASVLLEGNRPFVFPFFFSFFLFVQ